jgi:hypothetical protein
MFTQHVVLLPYSFGTVERVLLRGLAQATVKDFVERLAQALDVQIRSSSQPAAR